MLPLFASSLTAPKNPPTSPNEGVFSPSTPRFPLPPLDTDPNTLDAGADADALPPPKLNLSVEGVGLLSKPLNDGAALPPKANLSVAGAVPNEVPSVEALLPALAPNEKPPPVGPEAPPLPLEPNENPPPSAGAGVLLLVPKLNAMSKA